jgi:hypothetical protein
MYLRTGPVQVQCQEDGCQKIKNELEDLKAEDGQGRKQKKIMLVRYMLRDTVYGLSTSHISEDLPSNANTSSRLWDVIRRVFTPTL